MLEMRGSGGLSPEAVTSAFEANAPTLNHLEGDDSPQSLLPAL